MAEERHELVFMAKMTEHAERYNDMADKMKTLAQKLPLEFPDTNPEYQEARENGTSTSILLDDERNLLSVAYKNIVGSRRNAWRVVDTSEQHLQQKIDGGGKDEGGLLMADKLRICQEYKKVIEQELNEICDEVTDLLDKYLIKNADAGGPESKIFYLKMKGDYFRYKVEVASKEARESLSQKSEDAYGLAWDTATQELKATHPIRLGLALNYSVFHYEIRNKPEQACKLAKDAFDKAINDLDSFPGGGEEHSYKDSTLIMQLLRDNLTLWRSEVEDECEQQEEN